MTAARKRATYDDLLALPEGAVGQLIDGELHAQPRPGPSHANASSALGADLDGPFRRGRGGPGGWIILDEPELHLGGDVLVPDLASWRRDRLPERPATAHFELAPDWICEVLSPSTERVDRGPKLRAYAREGVSHVWLVNPASQILEVFERVARVEPARYALLAVHSGDEVVHAAPFAAHGVALAALWNW